MAFLGYDPLPKPDSLPGQLRAARWRLGLTQAQLAERLGVNRSTVQDAERGRGRRQRRVSLALGRLLDH